jgi:hypothetical protein
MTLNGIGPYPIWNNLSQPINDGDMFSGQPAVVVLATYGGSPVWFLLNPSNELLYPDVQSVQGLTYNYSPTPAGVVNAYQADINHVFFNLKPGMSINFIIDTGLSNTISNPTLAVNGTAAKTIYRRGGVALSNGDVSDARLNCVYYDGVLDGFILTSV